jgi:translation initiation factor IF-2
MSSSSKTIEEQRAVLQRKKEERARAEEERKRQEEEERQLEAELARLEEEERQRAAALAAAEARAQELERARQHEEAQRRSQLAVDTAVPGKCFVRFVRFLRLRIPLGDEGAASAVPTESSEGRRGKSRAARSKGKAVARGASKSSRVTVENPMPELVKRTGDDRCGRCVQRNEDCLVSEGVLADWREEVEEGKVFSRVPAAAGCSVCRGIRKYCELPETADLRAQIGGPSKSNKRKREEASGSGLTAAEKLELPQVKRQRSGTSVDEEFHDVEVNASQVMGLLWRLTDRGADAVDLLGRIADSLERIADHVDVEGTNFVQQVLRGSQEPEEEFESGELSPGELSELRQPVNRGELERIAAALSGMPEEEIEDCDGDTDSEAMSE